MRIGIIGQDADFRLHLIVFYFLQYLHTSYFGHVQVKDDQVGIELPDHFHGRSSIVGFSHDGHLVKILDLVFNSFSHHG